MSQITQVYVLVGALAGRTVKLGDYQFNQGRCTVIDTPEQMALRSRFLERNWQALPENDPRIPELQAAIQEAIHGKREVPQGESGPNGPAPVHGNGEPGGQGAPAGGEADPGAGAAGTETGSTERPAAGQDGQPPGVNEKLVKAIQSLNPADDAHWTKDGKPAMVAVEAAYGSAAVTRADVEAAIPDYTREAAKAAAEAAAAAQQ